MSIRGGRRDFRTALVAPAGVVVESVINVEMLFQPVRPIVGGIRVVTVLDRYLSVGRIVINRLCHVLPVPSPTTAGRGIRLDEGVNKGED